MTTLPADTKRLIASAYNLSVKDIISLCKSSKEFNAAICNSQSFWVAKSKGILTDDTTILKSISPLTLRKDLYMIETQYPNIVEFAGKGYDIIALKLARDIWTTLDSHIAIPTLEDAIFEAARNKHIKLVDDLLSIYEEFNLYDEISPRFAVQGAAATGDRDYLAEFEEKYDHDPDDILIGAARGTQVDLFLEKYDIYDMWEKPFAWHALNNYLNAAARGNSVELVKFLLPKAYPNYEEGVDLSKILYSAELDDALDVVYYLLPYHDPQYDVNITPAVEHGDLNMVLALLPFADEIEHNLEIAKEAGYTDIANELQILMERN